MNFKFIFNRILALLICSFVSIQSMACGTESNDISQTSYLFDTIINIKIYDSSKSQALSDCMQKANYYNNLWNKSIEGSDIYRINHSNNEPVSVDFETIDLLTTAIDMYEISEHVFNPMIGAVTSLWNFNEGIIPSESALNEALKHTDINCISINNNQVTITDPNASVDIGAIAKGYIADRLKEELIKNGVQSAIINLGGNILTIGNKPDGSDFKVGIVDPDNTSSYITAVTGNDISVVTSGIYERSFTQNGILYHHILDVNSGHPVDNNLNSVSIVYKDSTIADALSTICFIQGPEKSQKYTDIYPGIKIIYVMKDRSIYTIE